MAEMLQSKLNSVLNLRDDVVILNGLSAFVGYAFKGQIILFENGAYVFRGAGRLAK